MRHPHEIKGDRPAHRRRRRTGPAILAVLPCPVLLDPGTASAAESTGATFIDETVDSQTDPANFGFAAGARIGDGVLTITEAMGDDTTSVRPFDSSIRSERALSIFGTRHTSPRKIPRLRAVLASLSRIMITS